MKKILLALVIIFSGINSAQATGLKLYVGAAEYDEASGWFFLQLVVCNNTSDTVYIKRDDLDMIYPKVTTDASIIGDGGSFFLLSNVTNLITDNDRLFKLVTDHMQQNQQQSPAIQHKLYEDNNKVSQKEIRGVKYYVFAPNKCLTINTLTQTASLDFMKLADVSPEQWEAAEVFLTTMVWHHSYHDSTPRSALLIARSSEDLKKCVFIHNKKK